MFLKTLPCVHSLPAAARCWAPLPAWRHPLPGQSLWAAACAASSLSSCVCEEILGSAPRVFSQRLCQLRYLRAEQQHLCFPPSQTLMITLSLLSAPCASPAQASAPSGSCAPAAGLQVRDPLPLAGRSLPLRPQHLAPPSPSHWGTQPAVSHEAVNALCFQHPNWCLACGRSRWTSENICPLTSRHGTWISVGE